MYRNYVKRLLDIFLSLLALVVFSPLLLIVAILIKLESPGPVFFTQRRVGRYKEHFDIYKFRTMKEGTPAEVPTHLFANPERHITRIGKFLRKTSLNELPQLINIIKGDMSIIGPRQALWNQFDLIELRDKYKANDIRPGLSGWAQVNGRDTIDNETKAWFDGEYVNNIGFWFDVKCIVGTLYTVLTLVGVVEGGDHKRARQEAAVAKERA